MAVFWKNHLKDVDFSENALKEVPLGLFQLDVSLTALYFSFSALVRKISPHTPRCAASELPRQKQEVERKVKLSKMCTVVCKD